MVAVTNIGSEQLCSCSVPSRSTAVKPHFLHIFNWGDNRLKGSALPKGPPLPTAALGLDCLAKLLMGHLHRQHLLHQVWEYIYMYVIIAKVFITKLFFCKDKRWEPRTVKGEFGAEAHAGRSSMSFCRKQLPTLNVVRYIFYLVLRVTALKCGSLDFSAFWNVDVTVWCFIFP